MRTFQEMRQRASAHTSKGRRRRNIEPQVLGWFDLRPEVQKALEDRARASSK